MIIPIVFAFDNNLAWPASVCIFSLLQHAKENTIYDIFILHHKDENLNLTYINQVLNRFPKHSLQLRSVDDTFNQSFEIRGITTPAYYRLLIPKIIPEYDKAIYSDVDVIFRQDLSDLYTSTNMENFYVAAVNNLAHLFPDLKKHYGLTLMLDTKQIICSGFLIINSKKILHDNIIPQFLKLAKKRFKFQDQDIINITCKNAICQLPPQYSVLTYINETIVYDKRSLLNLWEDSEISEAMSNGNIHYNGQKPWKGWCINFDIWWEYYRKSPVFDEKTYFDFFHNHLNELDQLSLWKRIKILIRFFVYGRK